MVLDGSGVWAPSRRPDTRAGVTLQWQDTAVVACHRHQDLALCRAWSLPGIERPARSQGVPTGWGLGDAPQVMAFSRRVCKTVDVCLPWFESRTCHAKSPVRPGVGAGANTCLGAVRNTAPFAFWVELMQVRCYLTPGQGLRDLPLRRVRGEVAAGNGDTVSVCRKLPRATAWRPITVAGWGRVPGSSRLRTQNTQLRVRQRWCRQAKSAGQDGAVTYATHVKQNG
jgi:hypothetical protein